MNSCIDCGADVPFVTQRFDITPPPDRREGDGKPFSMCVACWDRMISAAVLTALRSGDFR